MKFAVFTVMLPELTPEDAAAELKAAGYDGVEWRFTTIPDARKNEAPSFWGNNHCTFAPTEDEARRARQIAEANGLGIPSLGTYLTVGDVPAVEHSMRLAQLCGAPAIRVGTGWTNRDAPTSYGALFEKNRAYLAEVEKCSRQYSVKGLVEIHHNSIASSASLARRLVDGFDPACVGVIHDAGNMVYEGYEDYRIGLEVLGPYLAHVHLKNAAYRRSGNGSGVWQAHWAPMDDGVVNFPALFAALREVGYDDWFSFEDFSAARPPREALRHNLAFIRTQVA
jgi:sugar phosphate isomerase/epimerase